MPKLGPVSWKVLIKVFEAAGYVRARQEGSHIVMVKPGAIRPLVIPAHPEVSVGVIQSCLRSAKLSREEYFTLLEKAR